MALDFSLLLAVALKIMLGFGSLAGVSALVAILVNFGKLVGLVKEGTSAKWSAGLNLLSFGALVFFGVWRPDLAIEVLDGYAGQIASILLFVLGFLIQIVGSPTVYRLLKGGNVPLLNFSFAERS